MKKSINKIGKLSFFPFCLILLLICMASNVHAYSVSGEINGSATGGVDIDYLYAISDEPTSLSNNLTSSGFDGSYAKGWFEANLGSGSMKTYASSRSVYPTAGAEMYVKSTMGDTLYFDIPAGTYIDGITVTLNGTVSGYVLHENQYSFASQQVQVTFGSPSTAYFSGLQFSSFSDSFSISYQLVYPGEVLAGLTRRSAQFGVVSVGNTQAAATEDNTVVDSISDFGNSMHITSLEIPDEVTAWRSDSGVFLVIVPQIADGDGDGDVDLSDAIIVLKLLAGIDPTTTLTDQYLPASDARWGMEELLYILDMTTN